MRKSNMKKQSRTSWTRVDAMKDDEIDYSMIISELGDDFFVEAVSGQDTSHR